MKTVTGTEIEIEEKCFLCATTEQDCTSMFAENHRFVEFWSQIGIQVPSADGDFPVCGKCSAKVIEMEQSMIWYRNAVQRCVSRKMMESKALDDLNSASSTNSEETPSESNEPDQELLIIDTTRKISRPVKRGNRGCFMKPGFEYKTRPFSCSVCQMKYVRKSNASRHIKIEHDGVGKLVFRKDLASNY